MQKFIAVRKEDAGEYFCRAKNDAGSAECPPQLMEVCKCITAAAHPESPQPTLQLLTFASLWFAPRRRHWRGGDRAGRAGGGGGAPVHHSRDLLRLQEGLLLQSKADGEQVRHQGPFLSWFSFNSVLPETKLDVVSLSYKVPAKGDGVDYVRTEDEVSASKMSRI